MLFIFSTCMANKYYLRIETEPELTISNLMLDMTQLKDALRGVITFPDGNLHEICRIDNPVVLMWNFGNYTRCSDASLEDFVHIRFSASIIEPLTNLKGTISLPYFILEAKHNEVFADEEHQILKYDFVFPEVSEQTRLSSLKKSLETHHYKVEAVDSSRTKNHYCQFSGGGDLCVTKDVTPPLVIVSPTNEVDQGTSSSPSSPSSSTSGGGMPSSNSSPLTVGDSKLASLLIEGKNHPPNLDKVKYQLWANMIVVTVQRFRDSLQSLTKEEIVALKQLLGYGMVCGANGSIGVYKLELAFGRVTMNKNRTWNPCETNSSGTNGFFITIL